MSDLDLYYSQAADLTLRYGAQAELGGGAGASALDLWVAPVSSAPVYTGPPIFAGIDMFYLTPSDLVGTIALGDPITDLPAQGGLITGNFSAAGTARPILQDDGTGRIGAFHDAVDDMLEISGLTLDLTAGHTFFCVRHHIAPALYRGYFRADAGSDAAGDSIAEYWVTTTLNAAVLNRLTSVVSGTASSSLGLGWFGHVADTGVSRGLYTDAGLVTATSGRAATVINRIQLAGYNKTKMAGYVYEWVLYKGVLSVAQIETVRDYMRTKWNGGSPF